MAHCRRHVGASLGIATTIFEWQPFGFATGAVAARRWHCPWYIQRCWLPLAMWRIRPGARPPLASTACGAISAMRSEHCSRVVPLNLFGLAVAMWIVTALTLFSGVIVAIRMAETLTQA